MWGSLCRASKLRNRPMQFTVPPSDTEKFAYIRGPQHRWFIWVHFLSFIGVVISLYGFARMHYWTLIFMIPLVLYAGETLLSLRTSTYRRRIDMDTHQKRVSTWSPAHYPRVDVMISTCGEDLSTLENTYRYTAKIAYPGRWEVFILDDAARPEVEALAKKYGYTYIARPGSEFKKAGNLQYAFERTVGEHILILDADFVPRPEILSETIPYMDDAEVGIIQTPQFYPSTKGLGWIECTAATRQEVFDPFVELSCARVEYTSSCDSAAHYRLAAVAAMGAFPLIAHSEDLFTCFVMITYAYRTAYVPFVTSQG